MAPGMTEVLAPIHALSPVLFAWMFHHIFCKRFGFTITFTAEKDNIGSTFIMFIVQTIFNMESNIWHDIHSFLLAVKHYFNCRFNQYHHMVVICYS